MDTLILHNERAGFGSDAIFMFIRGLVKEGDRCELRCLPAVWDADEAVADAGDFDLVVLSGGDGTVASLLYALRNSDTLVCVFPSGTANLYFANLGNTPEPAALARACRVGRSIRSDLGRVSWMDDRGDTHERGFAIMAGSGFDAELMRAAIPNKKVMGEAAYFLAALSNPKPPLVKFTIDIDGEKIVREGIACIVANAAKIQGDIEIVPHSHLDDGLLDVIVLETPDAVGLLKPLMAAVIDHKGAALGRPSIEGFQGKRISVRSSAPIPMQVDGEPLEGKVMGFAAEVVPHSSRIVVDALSPLGDHGSNEPLFSDSEERAFPE